MINILQIGLGPLGIKTHQYIAEKKSMQTVAAVDINPALHGKDLGTLANLRENKIPISNSIAAVPNLDQVDVVVLTTSSSIASIGPQIQEILEYKLPIVTTCEELSYPWKQDAAVSRAIDEKAKEKNVAVVATGVNPGFLMDTLPTMLTGVCKSVEHVQVRRIQDAQTRRIPFQKKIGAGLSLDQFEEKKQNQTLRHVGLTESMQFIADALDWKIDSTEDVISPIVAEENINTEAMTINKGEAMGVRQIGRATFQGKERIKLVFEAAVGTGVSYDEVKITGQPNIHSRIEGGVHGDIATCSIVLNTIPSILNASPGLKTMKDISLVSFTP